LTGADLTAKPQNPLTEEFLKRKPKQAAQARGDLASSSIFEDEEIAGPKPKQAKVAEDGKEGRLTLPRNPETMAAALDPDPESRKRWERKMVIREIVKRGRLSRAQTLKRQERELLSKSHDFKTSVKKLVPLAKQITGKTLEEAIVQMRFSAKKVAVEVKEHLEHAKNEAIVKRGMGLGGAKGFSPVKIQTKDGKRVKVDDPTRIYISQAWCGKGRYTEEPDYRARGRINVMKNRSTSKFLPLISKSCLTSVGLTVILKEEATRVRLHNEREEKEKNKKVWVQLPNRPITAQRQYYSW
jgi:ribosomal protein L22